jgi:hypothetical protein
MLIKDASNPTPFFVRKPIPSIFKTEVEKQRYWAKEKKIWIDGYSPEVNGMCYFYGTQIKLRDRVTAKIDYAQIRDVEVKVFTELQSSYSAGNSPFVMKGRGVGLSSIGMNLPFYFWKTNPGATCVATSKDKSTLATLFNDKTMVGYDELHEDIKFDLIRKNQTQAESFLKVGTNYIDHYGSVKYAESIFLCRDTQDSDAAATKFSGAGSIYGFADEAPLMKRFFKFFSSAIEIFKDHSQNRLSGLLLSGGTIEDTIISDDLRRLKQIVDKGPALNIHPIFIPATYGKHVVNGHSDHKRAEEEILKKRDELNKLDDKSFLNAYIKNNPLTLDEIFNLNTGGMFDEYTIQRVNEQKIIVSTEREHIPMAYNVSKIGDTFEATPATKSPIMILQHPKPGVEYIFGLDSIMTSALTSNASEVSDYCFTGMKGIDPNDRLQFAPVVQYKERPKTIYQAHETAIRVLAYYNQFGKAKVTGELNAAGEIFISMAIEAAMKSTILRRRDLSDKGYVDVSKFWFYRNDKILDWQIEAANIYLKNYSQMVFFSNILDDAGKGRDDNKDALDSLMACLYGFGTGDLFGKRKKKEEVEVKKEEKLKYVWKNGVFMQEWG